jgi:transcriptional regulator with XRE-family HTH domain
MATDPALGTRIKRARERRRWTQQQLAAALKVDRKTIDNWENGRAYPRSSIGAIEEVLGLSLYDDAAPARTISPEFRAEIMAVLDDPEDQRRVIGLLEGTITWPGEPAEGESGARRPAAG